jgi:hypothetical protein
MSTPVPPATPPTTARHQKFSLAQSAVAKSLQYTLDFPTGMGKNFNPRRGNGQLQRLGNRSADQHVGASLDQPGNTLPGLVVIESHVAAAMLGTTIDFDHQEVARHVEHRADPALPVRNSDFLHA